MAMWPGGWPPRIPFRPQVALVADRVRRELSRVDDAEVRKARKLARRSRAGGLDVVYFGDSTTSFVAPYDNDRRPLHAMIRDALGPEVEMHTIHGGSYSPPLFSTLLPLIEASPSHPVLVVPLCVRVRTVPWMEHPVHGRKQATAYLSQLDPKLPLRRIRKGFPRPGPEDWDAFHSLPHPTWAGEWSIGDYLEALRHGDRDDDWVRLLYAYHHGGVVPPGRPLDEVTAMGAAMRRMGFRVVAYETPVPVQKGEEFYPGFAALAERNLASLSEAFIRGYGEGSSLLRTGMVSGTSEFIDWRDASEHVNERGRRRLADAIASEVLNTLGRDEPQRR